MQLILVTVTCVRFLAHWDSLNSNGLIFYYSMSVTLNTNLAYCNNVQVV